MTLGADARGAARVEFERARRQAQRELLFDKLRGRESRLLPFDTIRRSLRQQSPLYRGLHEVPLSQIVGSVGRYSEMTREFLPLNDALRDRWIKMVELAQTEGWPPIDLYKIGNAYFVRDGNHRVSAARQLKFPTIEAHVWEFPEDVEIGPGDSLDEVMNRFRERSFLEATRLNSTHPEYRFQFTTCGRYPELQAQIEELRQKLELIDERPVTVEEAADLWYELIYLPTIQVIRDSGLLAAFPGRTEADMFVWLSLHRDRLQQEYGQYDSLSDLALKLMATYREKPAARMTRRVRRLLGGDELPPLQGVTGPTDEEE